MGLAIAVAALLLLSRRPMNGTMPGELVTPGDPGLATTPARDVDGDRLLEQDVPSPDAGAPLGTVDVVGAIRGLVDFIGGIARSVAPASPQAVGPVAGFATAISNGINAIFGPPKVATDVPLATTIAASTGAQAGAAVVSDPFEPSPQVAELAAAGDAWAEVTVQRQQESSARSQTIDALVGELEQSFGAPDPEVSGDWSGGAGIL